MILRNLATSLGYEFTGNGDVEITGIDYAESAKKGEVAVAFSKRDVKNASSASAILLSPCLVQTTKPLLMSHESIETALVRVVRCLIDSGNCIDYSILHDENYSVGNGTYIGRGAVIESHVKIGTKCVIGANAVIKSGSVIGDNVKIGSGTVIGADSFFHYMEKGTLKSFSGIGIAVIEDDVEIACNSIIQRGLFKETRIGKRTFIGNLVDVGHDCVIGQSCKIVSQTGISGHVKIGNNCMIFGQVGITGGVVIGNNVTIKGKSRVTKNIQDNAVVSGMYTRKHLEELKIQRKLRNL